MKIYTEKDSKEIIKSLKENNIIAIKTDTVFGIMALMTQENERKINKIKKTNLNKKVSIIVPDVDYLKANMKKTTKLKTQMIEANLPGKFTFIVELKKSFTKKRGFTRQDFGVRVTSSKFLQDIVKETGPLLASSCNTSTFPPCKNTDEIIEQFKDTNLEVVKGEVTDNTPSTIISLIGEIKKIR